MTENALSLVKSLRATEIPVRFAGRVFVYSLFCRLRQIGIFQTDFRSPLRRQSITCADKDTATSSGIPIVFSLCDVFPNDFKSITTRPCVPILVPAGRVGFLALAINRERVIAILEYIFSHARHAFRYNDARQTLAITERFIPDSR